MCGNKQLLGEKFATVRGVWIQKHSLYLCMEEGYSTLEIELCQSGAVVRLDDGGLCVSRRDHDDLLDHDHH